MRAALRIARGKEPQAALEELRAHHDEPWRALTLIIAAAYYTSPTVRELLGYTGPERRPLTPDEPADFAELLAPVIARGSIVRAVERSE